MTDRPKTIICDIDGTLVKHVGMATEQMCNTNPQLTYNSKEAINLWDSLGYNIILFTGRKESMRNSTIKLLNDVGIVYDQLVMGIGGGDRIIINDRKTDNVRNTAYAINVIRNHGIPHIDFRSKNVTGPDDYPTQVQKPWGTETLIECNDQYVVKKLFMKSGECCSLQYHELKRETIYVVSGVLKIHIGKTHDTLKTTVLKPGASVNIPPLTIHRMEGVEDSVYIETSTPELWDVVRLEDKYNRHSTNLGTIKK